MPRRKPPPRPAAPRRKTRAAPVAPLCYALVVPGIEDLAADELRRHGATIRETLAGFDKRDSVLLFSMPEPPRALRCGLIDDVFLLLLDVPVPPIATAPKKLAALLDRDTLTAAMLHHHAARPGRRGRSMKVVSRMAGQHPYRREDLETAFGRALSALLPHWVLTRDPAALEVWVHVIGGRAIAGVRLSGDELAQRTYKRAHLPASLTPTAARALVVLSDPHRDEIVLDPMCGAGTILRERTLAMPAALVLGGDSDAGAIGAARENVRRHAGVTRWDATRLPLADRSVDAVITNPPYGRQHEAERGLERLYARALREAARVLRPGGRCVVLTGEPALLLRSLPPALAVRSKRRMLLRGLPVTAFVMVRA